MTTSSDSQLTVQESMRKTKRDLYPVQVYNSLHNKKEIFQPLTPDRVGMYVCGPTVYGDPHLGHARSAISFDVVFRYFRFLGYKVRFVRNITDVGHLEDEVAGTGEDKIAKKARLEKVEPMEVVQTYTNSYRAAMDRLNNLRPSIEPTATGHIVEQIVLIEKILNQGLAYEVNGSVYFDLETYRKNHHYGELSGKVLEDLISGSRDTEGLDEKRNPHDFALWKSAKPEHIMRWPSPWGEGFPGWHIECTTMSTKYLGAPYDIHGGGMDLQFPHHECEIAQATAVFRDSENDTENHYARYWMHNNMVTLDRVKMSKSKGNFINLDQMFSGQHELLEQAYSPMTIRFYMLQAHYRSILDFSNSSLQAAEKSYKRMMNTLELLKQLPYAGNAELDIELEKEIIQLCDSCYEHMSDDFNTAKVLASLFELSAKIHQFYNRQLPLDALSEETFLYLKDTFEGFLLEVMGLKEESEKNNQLSENLIELLIDIRKKARQNKDYATSDQIRDQLSGMGVQLKDEKSGTSYTIS